MLWYRKIPTVLTRSLPQELEKYKKEQAKQIGTG